MARNRITITLEARIAVIRGWRAADLAKDAGLKPIYAGSVGGWMVDRHRVGDLLAYLEQRSIAVTVNSEKSKTREGDQQELVATDDVVGGGLW